MPNTPLPPDRFEIRRLLGKGGMGTVHEAYDRHLGFLVALKALQNQNGEALVRFKNEFRALADIRHPNLVRLGELHSDGEQWFFTMELVRGQSFIDYVRPASAPRPAHQTPIATVVEQAGASEDHTTRSIAAPMEPQTRTDVQPAPAAAGQPAGAFDETRLRASLRQLAVAIHALHQAGCVHRDIKPSNVLIESSGRVVLLDFGLIGELDDSMRAHEASRRIMGTPAFMAPEQVTTSRVGPPADWYAFGVMLFKALTGVQPFRGSMVQVLRTKRVQAAPRPSSLVSGLPADLDDLCADLLCIEVAERPAGAAILARLGVTVAGDDSTHPGARRGELFVGRRPEQAALVQILATATAGRPAAVVVEGEPGMGKTALVTHVLEQAAKTSPGLTILRGRAYEQESVPFCAFDAIIDSLSAHLASLPETVLQPLLGGGVQMLASVFPVLYRVPAIAAMRAQAADVDGHRERRERAFDELRQLLAALAQHSTLVLFIDDLHWADEDSLALIAHLLTPPEVPPMALIATMRASSAPLPALDALGPARAAFRHLRLGGLAREHAAQLLASVWSGDAPHDSGHLQLRNAVLGEARGHPLFLSELARWARSAGRVDVTDLHLDEALWQRIQRLEPHARRILELAAVTGVPVPAQVLADVAGVTGEDAQRALATLRTEHLVRMSRRGKRRLVEPYHDRVREAVRERMPPPPAEVHLALGRSLLAHAHPSELDAQVFTIMAHLDRGAALLTTEDEHVGLVELALRAGRVAKQVTAYSSAASYLERAEALCCGLGERADALAREIVTERMEVAYLMGKQEEGRACFARRLEHTQTIREVLDLYTLCVRLEVSQGDYKAAMRVAHQGLKRAGVKLPHRGTSFRLLRELSAVRRRLGRRALKELCELPVLHDEDIAALLRLLIALTPVSAVVDGKFMSITIARMVVLTLDHGVSAESMYALTSYATVLAGRFGSYSEAYTLSQMSIHLSETLGGSRYMCKLKHLCGRYITGWARPLADARRELQESCELGRAYGDPDYELYSAASVVSLGVLQSLELGAVEAEAERYLARLGRNRHQVDMTAMIEVIGRFCATLRCDSVAPAELPGRWAALDEQHRGARGGKALRSAYYHHALGAMVSYLLGDHERAYVQMRSARRFLVTVYSTPESADYTLYYLLITAELEPARARTFRQRRRLRKDMKQLVARLSGYADSSLDNFGAHYWLAAAEYACLWGDTRVAAKRYQLAVAAARPHSALVREAIALERWAHLCRSEGRVDEAEEHQRAAMEAYQRWGAAAKVAAMREGGGQRP